MHIRKANCPSCKGSIRLRTASGVAFVAQRESCYEPRAVANQHRGTSQVFSVDRNNIPVAMQRVIRQSRLQSVLLKLLIDRFFHLNQGPQKETAEQLIDVLKVAVECGDIQAVEMLRAAEVELSGTVIAVLGRDEPGIILYTLLHHAVQHQQSQMTSYFLKSVKPDVVDTRGRTPLHYAFKGNNSSAQVLLSHGADVSSRDDRGWTPLHVALYYGVSNGVSSLLNAGAEVNARDNAGLTPLDHCAFFSHSSHGNHSKAIKILLQAGASFSSFNPDGCTPLQIDMITAILTNSESDLFMVLNQQTDLVSSKLPPLDRTPLHFAAETGCNSSVLKLLVSSRADLEAEDKDGKTPVQVATKEAHQRLINIGARWRTEMARAHNAKSSQALIYMVGYVSRKYGVVRHTITWI